MSKDEKIVELNNAEELNIGEDTENNTEEESDNLATIVLKVDTKEKQLVSAETELAPDVYVDTLLAARDQVIFKSGQSSGVSLAKKHLMDNLKDKEDLDIEE